MKIYNEDCINPEHKLDDESVDVGIYDPPFGLGETNFHKHYKRRTETILGGYIEAPLEEQEYADWTCEWMKEAVRVLKPEGSMFTIIGHSRLRHVLNAAANLGLHEVNHIIWKFNFGVHTRKKFVTSHYHCLWHTKSNKVIPYFNNICRFGSHEKGKSGESLQYRDMEDIFVINKDYKFDAVKNINKLPEELIRKLLLYASKEGDMICDFFLGNFTTAYVALKIGRRVCGYELNTTAYEYHMPLIHDIQFGKDLDTLKKVENRTPPNQGKPVTEQERIDIWCDYQHMLDQGILKKEISNRLQEKYGRGKFSIKNIIDDMLERSSID